MLKAGYIVCLKSSKISKYDMEMEYCIAKFVIKTAQRQTHLYM